MTDQGVHQIGQLRLITHHQAIADDPILTKQAAQAQTIGRKLTHQIAQLQIVPQIGITLATLQRVVDLLSAF